MDFLATIKAPSPVFPNDQNAIISVGADAPVSQAFKVLIKNNILAAPVFDYAKNKYYYMFSMRDVVFHALRVLDATNFENETMPAITFLTEKDHFRNYKVQDIVGRKEKLVEIGTDITVDKVVELMVRTHAHRVVSLNPDRSLNNIITQSRVVECLVQLFDVSPSLGALGKQTVHDLELAKKENLTSISIDKRAVDAFKAMCENNISGLPVVGPDGTLVGNLSESDLRAIQSNAQYLKIFYLPLNEYMDLMHKHQREEPRNYHSRPIVKCEGVDSFRAVVERVVEHKVHRCYEVDSDGKLIGVISLHDILSALVKFSAAAP
jgi:CBS domain-containing protein